MFRSLLLAIVAAASLGAISAPANAGTLDWTGNTSAADGASTWHRPTVNTNPGLFLALAGSGQGYIEQGFTVDQTGNYSLTVSATGPGIGGWSNGSAQSILAFLYKGSFDAALPLINQIENGKCGGSGCGTPNWSHNLIAGTQYFIVVTGYCGKNSQVGECNPITGLQEGPFKASLTGPGAILAIGSAVPEPATWAMMIIGFGAAGATLRGRRTRIGVAAA